MNPPHVVDVTRYVIGALVLLALLVPVVLFIWPKVKGHIPSPKWPKISWINGRALVALAVGILITLTVREFWRPRWDQFFASHGQYAWLVVLAANVLFCLLFGRRMGTHGHTTGGHTAAAGHGHDSSPSVGRAALKTLALLILVAICGSIYQTWKVVGVAESRQAGGRFPVTTQPHVVEKPLDLPAGQWTPFRVEPGWNLFWVTPSHIQFKFGLDERPQDDYPGVTLRLPRRVAPYTVWLTPGQNTQWVRVYLHLTPVTGR